MFIWDWITYIFGFLNFRKREKGLLVLGLDNAGKTTLLNLLQTGKFTNPAPTARATREDFTFDSIHFTTMDLGGTTRLRRAWNHYYYADAYVFIVDASDHNRFEEVKIELQEILDNEFIKDFPILILGNKIDKKGAINEQELAKVLQVTDLMTGKNKTQKNKLTGRPLEVFMCSLCDGVNHSDGFRWLTAFL